MKAILLPALLCAALLPAAAHAADISPSLWAITMEPRGNVAPGCLHTEQNFSANNFRFAM